MYNRTSNAFCSVVRLPVAVACTVGMAVSTVIVGAIPQTAAAAPASAHTASPVPAAVSLLSGSLTLTRGLAQHPSATAQGDGIRPEQLRAVLLKAADLPGGYRQLASPTILQSNVLAPQDMGEPCTTNLGPLGPSATRTRGLSANVIWMKRDTGPFVSETLAAGDPRIARAFVAAIADRLRRCSTLKIRLAEPGDRLIATQTPLSMPQFGDASSALAFSIRVSENSPAVHGKLLAFAKGRVAGAVVLTGERHQLGGFSTLISKAVRRVKTLE